MQHTSNAKGLHGRIIDDEEDNIAQKLHWLVGEVNAAMPSTGSSARKRKARVIYAST